MQTLKKISFVFLFSGLAITADMNAQVQSNPAATVKFDETPAKTIFVKHPAANDAATFFSTSTVYTIYIFKPGFKPELDKIINSFKSDNAVEDCIQGQKTGDYQELTLNLKSAKDKMWFVALFKKAGLNNIKINNNKYVEVDKM